VAMDGPTPPTTSPLLFLAGPVAPVTGRSRSPAGADATSLVPEESSVGLGSYCPPDTLAPWSKWQRFQHAGWWTIREKIYQSLRRTHQSTSRLKAFDQCQSTATVQSRMHADGHEEFRFKGHSCHDRLCTPCASRRSRDIQAALESRMTPAVRPLLLTLTLRAEKHQSLADLTTKLYKSFRYLRATALWERSVKGGAAFLEITRGKKGDHWHVHFHCVCDSAYMPQAELSAAWLSITKDSFRVFIERPKATSGIAYCSKYACKGIDFEVIKVDSFLDEAVMTLKGRRLAFCFGDWYGTSFDSQLDSDPLDDADDECGKWSTLADCSALFDGTLKSTPRLVLWLATTPFAKFLLCSNIDSS
jgi:hypothetical protein